MKLNIVRKLPLTPDTFLFELRNPSGEVLPRFTSGAHVTIDVPNGMRRNYSLCGDPNDSDRYEIAVKREANGRGGSASLVDDSRVGDAIEISEPNNLFNLTSVATELLFVAGGIGITPILSMVRHVSRHTDLHWKLHYCTRNAECTAFRTELEELPTPNGKVTFHHSADQKPMPFDPWALLEKPRKGCHVYCCGPPRLMEAIKDTTGHWPVGSIHFENFRAEPIAVKNHPFYVRLKSTGERIYVPANRSIVEALRASGYTVQTSCESGTCGTCRTRLISGLADHRDMVLLENERANQVIPCVSRAQSEELLLDL
jgi:phthalate 4,5-dioxygenase reductase subunit